MELTLHPAPCAALQGLSFYPRECAVRNSDSFGFCRLDTGYPTQNMGISGKAAVLQESWGIWTINIKGYNTLRKKYTNNSSF